MVSVDNTRIRRGGLAAIAAVAVFMALAVTGALPAGVAGQPTAAPAEVPAASGAAAQGHLRASRTGSSEVGLRGHGFVRDASGTFATIDIPGAGSFTVAFGINNHGEIVGAYSDDAGAHGFVLSNGTFTMISAPSALLFSVPFDIDDHGRIVGSSF